MAKTTRRIAIATHHKTGTVWMDSVFQQLCHTINVPYVSTGPINDLKEKEHEIQRHMNDNASTVVLDWHCRFPTPILDTFKILQVYRDPRDVILSAAAYHSWSREPWLHIPREAFGGLSYQQKFNSLGSDKERLIFEMQWASRVSIVETVKFHQANKHRKNYRSVKYEDLITDEKMTMFEDILRWFDFDDTERRAGLNIFWERSLFGNNANATIKPLEGHIRDGRPEQWRTRFDDELLDMVTRMFGKHIDALGYPRV